MLTSSGGLVLCPPLGSPLATVVADLHATGVDSTRGPSSESTASTSWGRVGRGVGSSTSTHVVLDVVVLGAGVVDVVLGLVEGAECLAGDAGESRVAGLVLGELPEEVTTEALGDGVLGLALDDVGGVVGDELTLGTVVGVGGDEGHVFDDLGTGDCGDRVSS